MERSPQDSSDRQLVYHTWYKTSNSCSATRWSCQWSCCTAQALLNILPSLPKFLCTELCVCKWGVINSETRHQIYQTTNCNLCNKVVLSVMQLYWSIRKHCFIFFFFIVTPQSFLSWSWYANREWWGQRLDTKYYSLLSTTHRLEPLQ